MGCTDLSKVQKRRVDIQIELHILFIMAPAVWTQRRMLRNPDNAHQMHLSCGERVETDGGASDDQWRPAVVEDKMRWCGIKYHVKT